MELPPFVPTPEEGLELLSSVTPHLQPAFDNALFKSTTYVEAEDLKCDATTFLTLVRAHAKSYLLKLTLEGIRFKDWSLSGIEFEVNGAIFRCWKGLEKELPTPGESKGRRRFLNQQYPIPFEYDGITKVKNFVILYTVGALNKLTLWLVCPKKYDEEERIAEAWWWIQIAEPASSMSGPTNIGQPPSDDLLIDARKLPKIKNETE